MKKLIVFGTKDGVKINDDHFGQSAIYVVCEVENGKVVKRSEIENPYHGNHMHAKVEEILEILGDYKVWIGKTMGNGSMKKLAKLGYEAFLTTKGTVEEALKEYLGG